MDPFFDLYARVIVEHSLAVAPGETVLVEGSTLAADLADAIHRRALRAGANVLVMLEPAGYPEIRLHERRRVVDTVADHRHAVARRLQPFDLAHLVRREDLCDDLVDAESDECAPISSSSSWRSSSSLPS